MSKPKLLFDYTKVDSDKVHKRIVIFAFIPIITSIIFFQIYDTNVQVIPFTVLAMMAGLILEDIKLTKEWKDIFIKISMSFSFSFFAFLPGKRETNYIFEEHLFIWPYVIIIMYTIISIGFHGRKIISKLNEGIVMVQTLALVYWVSEFGFDYFDNYFLSSILILGLLFSIYSFFHSFSYTPLTRLHRFILSIWSTILMLIFAIDNIIRIYSHDVQNNSTSTTETMLIYHQYFLLGVSCIYIVRNLFMLIEYLPDNNDQKGEYKQRIKKATINHIVRFSNKQFKISHSITWFIILTVTFSCNYFYHFLPINIMIGTVIFIFPMIMNFIEKKINPRDNVILNSSNTLNLN